MVEGFCEIIHFFYCVVECEGGAGCALEAESVHEGLGAVVAGADGDSGGVEHYGDVVGVDATWAQNMLMKFCFILGAVQLSLGRIINIIRKD